MHENDKSCGYLGFLMSLLIALMFSENKSQGITFGFKMRPPLPKHKQENPQTKKQNHQKTSTGKDVQKLEPLCINDGGLKWENHPGKEYDSSSKN